MLKGIIFDLDGTLINTLDDIATAMNQTLSAFELPQQPLSVYRQLIGGGSRSMINTIIGNHELSDDKKELIFEHYLQQYNNRLVATSKPYQGIAALLQQLQAQHIKLMVVTNKLHHQAVLMLHELLPQVNFDFICGLHGQLAKKPDPQLCHITLKQTGLKPSECLYIGDTATDMLTAQNSSIAAIYVDWGYGNLIEPNQYSIAHQASTIAQLQQQLSHYLPSLTKQASQEINMNPTSNSITNQIANLIESYLFKTDSDKFAQLGKTNLEQKLLHFIENNQAIDLILPGFPCKSPNDIDKSFSVLPDYGEVIAIERLDKLCHDINVIYPAGSNLTILSDGTTFADVVQVKDETKHNYNQALREITVTENIQWADLTAIIPALKPNQDDNSIRKALLKTINNGPRPFERFIEKVKNDPKQANVHDNMCSYLYHDINLERFNQQCRDGYLASIAEKAYHMMYRGKALNKGIDRYFPHHIRLSVHQYDNSGPKYTFALNEHSTKAIAPWHSVPVRLTDGRFIQLPHSIAKQRLLALVTLNQQKWFYLEVDSVNLTEFSYEVVKGPRFGLRIADPKGLGYQHFDSQFLQRLSEQFGFILLKDAPIAQQQDLVAFCQPYGDIYHWKFGPVHVVKPEENPDGFVHSIHKTPLHWDLSMLPKSDENVQKDPRFAASTFMLYCKTPPAAGEGQTTLVDSRIALKLAGQQKVQQWKNTNITYQTKMTYFGGDAHTYPLVFEHPKYKDDIFRYQEGSDLQMQQFLLSNEQMNEEEFNHLVKEVNDIAYHPRCLVEHEWQAGDLIIIDNLYTLHGRQPMTEKSMSRELWRVQAF